MKKRNGFIESFKRYKTLVKYSSAYQLCWFPSIQQYSVIEIFKYELKKIDENKVEIIKVNAIHKAENKERQA